MEGTEPFVPRDFEAAVVTLEISVVHLVVECPKRKAVLVVDQKALKPRMCRDGGKEIVLQMEQDMDRVCTDDEVDKN